MNAAFNPDSAMRILFLTHSFNSLTQRLFVELRARGHEVSIELDIADSVSEEAVKLYQPDLIVAPFLKRAVPESIWRHHICLIVHPGIIGDRGPSALDWAIVNDEAQWGVTVLQANAELDAGDIWASATFRMRRAKKSSLYRNEVTNAALAAVLAALEKFQRGERPLPLAEVGTTHGLLRPLLRQEQRRIDWRQDDSATILRKINSGDGFPGVLDALFGQPCYLYDAHPATPAVLTQFAGKAGDIVARRDDALLRLTRDGGLWIGYARLKADAAEGDPPLKLPTALCVAEHAGALPELPVALTRPEDDWAELRYWERGVVGYLSFDFYNGAMSSVQCERMRDAVRYAKSRPTKVLVLMGGADFFSNGIHLNCIEAAAHREGESAADESWRNINAMDDLALEILTATDHLTVSALRGNAGAGGAFLALAADLVWAHEGVLLNPHYKNMGNLYGSEYWTYLLPQRVGSEQARGIMQNRWPRAAPEAVRIGLIDAAFGSDAAAFESELAPRAQALAADGYPARLAAKRDRRARDEACKPLQAYRDEELIRMRRNFYGFDPSYHVARYHFVHKMPHAWTPRHLALHRK